MRRGGDPPDGPAGSIRVVTGAFFRDLSTGFSGEARLGFSQPLHLFFLSIGLGCALAAMGCDKTKGAHHHLPADLNSAVYRFPTRNVTGFNALITEAAIPDAQGLGYLFLPVEATSTTPVPLMVILHGSGGTWGGRGARHAEFLIQHGIGALVVDTFCGRGLSKKKDGYIHRLMEANVADQLSDAFGALDALQSHPFVDGNRIGIMGYSMGGASAILAAYETIAAASSTTNVRFALYIAFYAPCIIQPSRRVPTGAPVIALWGTDDDATPKSRCDGFLRAFEDAGGFVQTAWYDGATHGWNGIRPARVYPRVPNFSPCEFVIQENGQIRETRTGNLSDTDRQMIENADYCDEFGYAIGRHDQTNELADADLLKAIRQHLRTDSQ